MKKILWLASWYPNKISPMNGDFIKRHAEAVSIYENIHVIFVVKDESGTVTNRLSIETFHSNNLSETIAYYKPVTSGLKIIDRFISLLTYLNVFRKLINEFIKNNGLPKLTHVHVAMWAGVMALWLKRKFTIPYILTEHWTGYDKRATDNIFNKGWLFGRLTRSVISNAEIILPVSQHLGRLMRQNVSTIELQQVSNVVNTTYFKLSDHSNSALTFIHVSSMNYQKNIDGMLRAFARLSLSYKNWKLVMAGPATIDLKNSASSLGLKNNLEWKGEISYEQVAEEMKQSSALVLFSRYENQPCVILEALCCGLPVIATDVGGINEVINEQNGLLVQSENETAFVDALIKMIESRNFYNKIQISQLARDTYNYNIIGKIIADLYKQYPVG